jgi:3-hydroxyisobutyrate dehydrogenase-like beta-hydroxyacid dehydrogenase
MAARLVSRGWRVIAHDVSAARLQEAQLTGVTPANDPAHCASESDGLVGVVVRTAEQVDEVLFGPRGVAAGRRGARALIMSTVGAAEVVRLAERAIHADLAILDAPIYGNGAAAEAGKLIMLVAGDRDVAAEAEAPFKALAQAIINLGDRVGAAQVVKMVSQLQQIVGMLATLEGVVLAEAHGLEEQAVVDVLDATSPTWTTDNWAYARELWQRRDAASSLSLFAKDLTAAIADGARVGQDLPIAAEALRLLRARYDPEGTPER